MKREWACGVSKIKHGFGDLREAYQEAGQALRYHRASEKEGVTWYKNIEALFSQSIPGGDGADYPALRPNYRSQ